ncbi:GntR family transcriptional regulator [Verticiella sediminum]|uniref:GntR family transcriptional regulator n=1 Tax=Verticiella sediminum TaxID=1247510 RepID=A0A556B215_9BURK|nr:GntR family transcriptional regulator [Verticiella sediminum]TSH99200.1 GntR family transcriptional regulator [Verticiella sediminum]
MNQIALHHGPVTLYAQLASIMRDRIMSGVWKSGDEIPTLDQMVREFAVARVTVRQAVQMLADEGLLSSQRGRRTYVTWQPPTSDDANPIFSYTGSVDKETANYAINVLSKQEFDELPAHLAFLGEPHGRYVRIRKVDSENGIPYVISDNYVALPVYRRIPANGEKKAKLVRLVRDHAQTPIACWKERITVTALNYEDATHLQVPIGSPAARIVRVFLDADDKILYTGHLLYRADRFAVDRDITDLLYDSDRPAASGRAARRTARSSAQPTARRRTH